MRAILHLIRKEKPVPGPKPPSQPPPKDGIRTPGTSSPSPGGMICPGAGR
jgi:hypothetical protein